MKFMNTNVFGFRTQCSKYLQRFSLQLEHRAAETENAPHAMAAGFQLPTPWMKSTESIPRHGAMCRRRWTRGREQENLIWRISEQRVKQRVKWNRRNWRGFMTPNANSSLQESKLWRQTSFTFPFVVCARNLWSLKLNIELEYPIVKRLVFHIKKSSLTTSKG